MTIAVDFDDEQFAGAIKVGDVIAQWLLAAKSFRQITQEFVPEFAFRGSRIVAKCARTVLTVGGNR